MFDAFHWQCRIPRSIAGVAVLADLIHETLTGGLTIRSAREHDIPQLVELLCQDETERRRSQAGRLADYESAFAQITSRPDIELVVVTENESILGTLQLSYIRCLTWRGGLRAQIHAVRIDDSLRGNGLGTQLVSWAIARAREQGCLVVQLSTGKWRSGAHRFYERMGFEATHEGFKLTLP